MDRYEREAREKQREIKKFNEDLKNRPDLLNDELYLFASMPSVRLKLKQLPGKHLDNLLLMTEYFKTNRDFVNYKHIKPEILNNPLFLVQTIGSNPDFYFIISDKNKATFKSAAISSENEYLKYLSNEDYDNPALVKKISNNFNYFHESLSCISVDNFKKLLKSPNGEHLQNGLLSLKLEQCQYLKEPLKAYIEESRERNSFWFTDALNKNPYFYTVLDKDKYKDEDSKKLIVSLAGKYHNLFPYLPTEWKTDLEIIAKVITDNTQISYKYMRYGNKYHEMVKDVSLVLNEYKSPEQFIQEKLYDKEVMTHLRKAYPQLSLEWRSQEPIIKSLFKERDSLEIDLDYCRSIPDEKLAEKLVDYIKESKQKRTLEHIGAGLEATMNHHYLEEKLGPKEGNDKKPKI
jgi:hypothetical protein